MLIVFDFFLIFFAPFVLFVSVRRYTFRVFVRKTQEVARSFYCVSRTM